MKNKYDKKLSDLEVDQIKAVNTTIAETETVVTSEIKRENLDTKITTSVLENESLNKESLSVKDNDVLYHDGENKFLWDLKMNSDDTWL